MSGPINIAIKAAYAAGNLIQHESRNISSIKIETKGYNNYVTELDKKAEKTINWKKTLSDGSYPPPPLNDTAHAWHHPKWQLIEIITNGGAKYDGKMPPFKNILTNEEKEDAIAYFQSLWSDEFYNLWLEGGGLKKKSER